MSVNRLANPIIFALFSANETLGEFYAILRDSKSPFFSTFCKENGTFGQDVFGYSSNIRLLNSVSVRSKCRVSLGPLAQFIKYLNNR